jgi:hypothetical protein
MLIFEGNINPNEAEQYWKAFAKNLKTIINKN